MCMSPMEEVGLACDVCISHSDIHIWAEALSQPWSREVMTAIDVPWTGLLFCAGRVWVCDIGGMTGHKMLWFLRYCIKS